MAVKSRFLSLAAGLFFLSGCSPVYVLKSAAGHSSLLWHRKNIDKAAADSKTPEPLRKKLRLLQEIRRFAFKDMGLRSSRDYSTFSEIHRPYVTYVVTGCEKTRFNQYQWWFPIIGKVPYKGYFKKEDAARERTSLERKGYDAHVGGVTAYNTPLWFSDPLPSPVLEESAGELASLVIHELTHGTIFIKNEVGFDEALATFVGNQGAEDFLARRFGPASKELQDFRASLVRDRSVTEFFKELYSQLDALYQSAVSEEAKLKSREEFFDRGRQRLGFSVNNAVIMGHRLYNHNLDDFKAVYDKNGRDWPKTLAALKSMRPQK